MAETGIKGGIGFQLPVLAAHPAPAPTGTVVLYRLNDGKLYAINDAGVSSELGSGGGITDHGALTGLDDHDHPQYALASHDHATLYAALSHNHDGVYAEVDHHHDDRYYTQDETDTLLSGKADSVHVHDDHYYTETETDTLLSGKADSVHVHDDRYYTQDETDTLLSGKADSTDPRFPTSAEKAALSGTGTPSANNQYVTDDDARLSDARPPTAHTHDATDLTTGTMNDARLSANVPRKDGHTTFTPSTDSTTVLAVQNAAGTVTLFAINTTEGKIVIDGDIDVSGRVTCAGIDTIV